MSLSSDNLIVLGFCIIYVCLRKFTCLVLFGAVNFNSQVDVLQHKTQRRHSICMSGGASAGARCNF